MPPRRPAPLSDEQLNAPPPVTGATTTTTEVLGATNNGVPLQVKNTFIDVPSVMTPTNMTVDARAHLATAPAHYQPGFIQRAIVTHTVVAPAKAPPTPGRRIVVAPGTPVGGPASPAGGQLSASGRRFICVQEPPLMTPSPTNASMAMRLPWGRPGIISGSTMNVYQSPPAGVIASAGVATLTTQVASAAPPLSPPPDGSPAMALLSTSPSKAAAPPPAAPATYVVQGPTIYQNAPVAASVATMPGQAANATVRPAVAGMRPGGMPIRTPWEPPELGCLDEDDDAEDDDSENEAQQQQQPGRKVEDAPKPPPGALHPSLGSDQHAAGTCKRCCFFPRGRCTNGYECEFCHYDHEKRKRKNKKKKKKDGSAAVDGISQPGAVRQVMQVPGGGLMMMPSQASAPHPVMYAMPRHAMPPAAFTSQVVMPTTLPQAAPAVEVSADSSPTQQAPAQPPQYVAQANPMILPGYPPPQYVQGPQFTTAPPQYMMPPPQQYVLHNGQVVMQPHPPFQYVLQPPPQQAPAVQSTAGLAPPPPSPPNLQFVETTAPPPMQSPKLGQSFPSPLSGSVLAGTIVPPPMVSPKLPRSIVQVSKETQSPVSAAVAPVAVAPLATNPAPSAARAGLGVSAVPGVAASLPEAGSRQAVEEPPPPPTTAAD